jgi:hypothetical protein
MPSLSHGLQDTEKKSTYPAIYNYIQPKMLEEKIEKEKIQRCRVERLLATREKEKVSVDGSTG